MGICSIYIFLFIIHISYIYIYIHIVHIHIYIYIYIDLCVFFIYLSIYLPTYLCNKIFKYLVTCWCINNILIWYVIDNIYMYDVCDIMRPTKNTKMVMLTDIQYMGIQASSLITITLLLIPYTLPFFRNPLRSITDFSWTLLTTAAQLPGCTLQRDVLRLETCSELPPLLWQRWCWKRSYFISLSSSFLYLTFDTHQQKHYILDKL